LTKIGHWPTFGWFLPSIVLCTTFHLFVCVQHILSCGQIRMKFYGQVWCVTRENRLDFGEDLDPDPTTRILKVILHIERSGKKRYIARYLKRLWTDSDETWWTGWVCRKDALIRFWWRSECGSGHENYLIFKVILFHWAIGPKTI